MSKSALPPLTFGVELEMAIACIRREYDKDPDPTETRNLRFHPTDDDIANYNAKQAILGLEPDDSDPNDRAVVYDIVTTINCKKHIQALLSKAGLPVGSDLHDEYAEGDFSVWEIVEDISINDPEQPNPYYWAKIEIRSPAYFFNRGALEAVQQVCDLLATNYCVNTSNNCGLHVHVGKQDTGFDDQSVRNLMSFVWAFEPQLNSILGQRRFNIVYCVSPRESSRYAMKYMQKYGMRPKPITGVQHFQEDQDLSWVAEQSAEYKGDLKFNSVNFKGLHDRAKGDIYGKPTIEFRQHEGTIDAERVTNWISTVVGIVDFVCHAYPHDLHSLLLVSTQETWETLGDGTDESYEESDGPVLAEGNFTAVHLFEWMGLHGPANFYRDKMTVIEKTDSGSQPGWILWPHEHDKSLSEEERTGMDLRRELFESMRQLKLNEHSVLKFDQSSPFWPPHEALEDDIDRDTDESSEASSDGGLPSEESETRYEESPGDK
ncbi:hypothetical protein EG329_002374 [Mollisiaceae sp. DMI_Dod_QoI]|nr:hypothetical protein EG329_002374 [Helotiales sp. DMI_Dod_QoI]